MIFTSIFTTLGSGTNSGHSSDEHSDRGEDGADISEYGLNTKLAPLFYTTFRRFASVRHRISAIRIMVGWPLSGAPVPYLAGI